MPEMTESDTQKILSIREMLQLGIDSQNALMDSLLDRVAQVSTNLDQRLVVQRFSIDDSLNNIISKTEWNLSLNFHSQQDYQLWSVCVAAALVKLEIPPTALSNNFYESHDDFPESFGLELSLTIDEMGRVLPYLKPLADRSTVKKLSVGRAKNEVVDRVMKFLGNAPVNTVHFDEIRSCSFKSKRVDDFTMWLSLVHSLKPSKLTYRQKTAGYSKNFIDFLMASSEDVDNIWIASQGKAKGLSIDVVKGLLSRKCTSLHVCDDNTIISLAQVEDLTQHFQDTGKKVSIVISTDGTAKAGRFANYEVTKGFWDWRCEMSPFDAYRKKLLLIEHVEKEPKAGDDEDIVKMRNRKVEEKDGEQHQEMMDLLEMGSIDMEIAMNDLRAELAMHVDLDKALLNDDELIDQLEFESDEDENKDMDDFQVDDYDMADDADSSSPQENGEQLRDSPLVVSETVEVSNYTLPELHAVACEVQQNNSAQMIELVEELQKKRLNIDSVRMTDEFNSEQMKIQFDFKTGLEQSLWKTCLTAILCTLDISEKCVNSGYNRRDNTFFSRNHIGVQLRLTLDEVTRLIPCVKPLMERAHIERASITDENLEFIPILADLLKGSSVKTLSLQETGLGILNKKKKKEMEEADFALWLKYIRTVRPAQLMYLQKTKNSQDAINFLGKAAEVVDSIFINSICRTEQDISLKLSIMRAILSQKCQYLTIFDSSLELSLAQVTELVQHLQSICKKASFTGIFAPDIVADTRIGDYIVRATKQTEHCKSYLLIEHFEMKPQEDEETNDI